MYLQIVDLHKKKYAKKPNTDFFDGFGSAVRELSAFINRILK